MSRKRARFFVTIFLILSVIVTIYINQIPTGNFIGAPAITLMIYFPLGVVQLCFLIQLWIIKENARLTINLIFYLSLIILVGFLLILYHFYIRNPY